MSHDDAKPPREWWILEYSDKSRECFTEKETRGDTIGMIHVIEKSAYDAVCAENEELKDQLRDERNDEAETFAVLRKTQAELAKVSAERDGLYHDFCKMSDREHTAIMQRDEAQAELALVKQEFHKALQDERDANDSLRAELERLQAFKDDWDKRDGNSPGYNLQKARTYGEQAAKYKAEAHSFYKMADLYRSKLVNLCAVAAHAIELGYWGSGSTEKWAKDALEEARAALEEK